jgi:hypothetical protein
MRESIGKPNILCKVLDEAKPEENEQSKDNGEWGSEEDKDLVDVPPRRTQNGEAAGGQLSI